MEPKPSVILGKPMRKHKPVLLPEDDAKISTDKATVEVKETILPMSPSKPIKTLLEERFDSKHSDTAPSQQETIGVDKRLLLSMLSSKKVENTIGCCWTPFTYAQSISDSKMDKIRKRYKILVEGSNIPPLALKFKDMRLPNPLYDYLENIKNISDPSLIQMQGIPVALAGRDLIGIASTGSGKTLAFCIPLILFALEAEIKYPFLAGEGPVAIILAPSVRLIIFYSNIYGFIERISATNFPAMLRNQRLFIKTWISES